MLRSRPLTGLFGLFLVLALSPLALAGQPAHSDDADPRPEQVRVIPDPSAVPALDRPWVGIMLRAKMRVIALPDAPSILPGAVRIYAAADRLGAQRLTAVLVDFSSAQQAVSYRRSHRSESVMALTRGVSVSLLRARTDDNARRAKLLIARLQRRGWH